jgi:hypothetical protein
MGTLQSIGRLRRGLRGAGQGLAPRHRGETQTPISPPHETHLQPQVACRLQEPHLCPQKTHLQCTLVAACTARHALARLCLPSRPCHVLRVCAALLTLTALPRAHTSLPPQVVSSRPESAGAHTRKLLAKLPGVGFKTAAKWGRPPLAVHQIGACHAQASLVLNLNYGNSAHKVLCE